MLHGYMGQIPFCPICCSTQVIDEAKAYTVGRSGTSLEADADAIPILHKGSSSLFDCGISGDLNSSKDIQTEPAFRAVVAKEARGHALGRKLIRRLCMKSKQTSAHGMPLATEPLICMVAVHVAVELSSYRLKVVSCL